MRWFNPLEEIPLAPLEPHEYERLNAMLRGEAEPEGPDALPALTRGELQVLAFLAERDALADTYEIAQELGRGAEPTKQAEAGIRGTLTRLLEKDLVGFRLSKKSPDTVWRGYGWAQYAGKPPKDAFWLASERGENTIILLKYVRSGAAVEAEAAHDPTEEGMYAPREIEFYRGEPEVGWEEGWPDLPWTRTPSILEPTEFDPVVLEEEARYDRRSIAIDHAEERGMWRLSAWDTSDYMQGMPWLVGELWLHQGPVDARRYGRRPRYGYAAVASMWIHPEWRGRGLIETKLFEVAAELAASRGMVLASATWRPPPQEEFWLRQQEKGRARLAPHFGKGGVFADRYFLRYPPPESLENPW